MSEPEKATTEAAPKKGGKKMIIIIALVVVLLGGAGGGFYYWRASSVAAAETPENDSKSAKKAKAKKAAEEEESSAEDEKADAKADKAETGADKKPSTSFKDSLPDDADVKHIVELQPFIVNLADSEQARYLRLSVSLGIGGEGEASEKPDPLFTTRVRNAMLAVLGEKKSDDVLSVDGKVKLRKELLKAAQAVSEEPEVQAIYITDFIVQL
jgi:flagellar FliL protein